MAIIYTWKIDEMVTKPQEGQLNDVVVQVKWVRNAELTVGDTIFEAYSYGDYDCPTPSPTDFTAYPNLTYNQVCGWLNDSIGTTIDAELAFKIEIQVNPPTVVLPLPWETAI